jgi:tetratricopeptide (TPR) repeat protein
MTPRPLTCAAVLAAAAWVGAATAGAQSPWMKTWLDEYAAGQRVAVAQRLSTVASLKTFEGDLDKVAKVFLDEQKFPDRARQMLAAFALEAATSHLTQKPAATKLIEWGCRQVRRNMPPAATPGEFERRWHIAAFASLSGAIDPDALEAHTAHVRLQFPKEPRIPFERAVAAEQRTAPFLTTPRVPEPEITKRLQEAAAKYREAAADAGLRAEALMRLGRVELALDRADAAVEALRSADAAGGDADVQYLARLFLGQALERQGRRDEAAQAYRRALALAPGAQSAELALAALAFRQGARDEADRGISHMLTRPETAADPWWNYWPADFRRIDAVMNAMREALK